MALLGPTFCMSTQTYRLTRPARCGAMDEQGMMPQNAFRPGATVRSAAEFLGSQWRVSSLADAPSEGSYFESYFPASRMGSLSTCSSQSPCRLLWHSHEGPKGTAASPPRISLPPQRQPDPSCLAVGLPGRARNPADPTNGRDSGTRPLKRDPGPPLLTSSILRELDEFSYDGTAGSGPPSLVEQAQSVGSSTADSAHLLEVKRRVSLLRRAQWDAEDPTGRKRRRAEVGAYGRAEERFDKGAMCSSTSSDSQGRCLSGSDPDSADSNVAVVSKRTNPQRGHQARRQEMEARGVDAGEVRFEMMCHMTPKERAEVQKQRARLNNRYWRRRRREYFERKAEEQQRAQLEAQQQQEGLRVCQHEGSHDPTVPCSCGYPGTVGPRGACPAGSESSSSRDQPTGWGSNASQDATSPRIERTHDDLLIVVEQQKRITKLFVQLQKRRDRGQLTNREFESAKAGLLGAIFDVGEDGHVFAKTEFTAAEADRLARNYMRGIRRKRSVRGLPGWGRDTVYDTDAALEEGLDDVTLRGDSSDDEPRSVATRPETWKRDAVPIVTPASKRRAKNIERRQMLMRRIDQRAPPEHRLFLQDTSYAEDERRTPREPSWWGAARLR